MKSFNKGREKFPYLIRSSTTHSHMLKCFIRFHSHHTQRENESTIIEVKRKLFIDKKSSRSGSMERKEKLSLHHQRGDAERRIVKSKDLYQFRIFFLFIIAMPILFSPTFQSIELTP